MVVQALLDSLSRCFGAPGQPLCRPGDIDIRNHSVLSGLGNEGIPMNARSSRRQGSGENRINSHHSHQLEEDEALNARRRQGRALGLELHDQEWDALFHRDSAARSTDRKSLASTPDKSRVSPGPARTSFNNNNSRQTTTSSMEIGYTEALAKAHEAARPSRHDTPAVKPKQPLLRRKTDIFRSRDRAKTSFASKLLGKEGVAKALCFANPVHDSTVEERDARAEKAPSIADTLDTADDTITSTMYFENKYNSTMETNPPMPLFSQYKVETSDWRGNSLMGIVASGSHRSIHMQRWVDTDGTETNRRLFVPADGEPDKCDDVQMVVDVGDIHLMDSDVEDDEDEDEDNDNDSTNSDNFQNKNHTETQEKQQTKHVSSTSTEQLKHVIINTDALKDKHDSPPPVKPISESQSTGQSFTTTSRSHSFGHSHTTNTGRENPQPQPQQPTIITS